jgi:hypothetical protein
MFGLNVHSSYFEVMWVLLPYFKFIDFMQSFSESIWFESNALSVWFVSLISKSIESPSSFRVSSGNSGLESL